MIETGEWGRRFAASQASGNRLIGGGLPMGDQSLLNLDSKEGNGI